MLTAWDKGLAGWRLLYHPPYVMSLAEREGSLTLKPDQSLTGLYLGTPGNYRVGSEIRYSLNSAHRETSDRGQFISLIEPSPSDYQLTLEMASTAPHQS